MIKVNNSSVIALSISLISDTLFTSVCTFLVSFTAIRHYTKNASLALGLAIALALLAGALALYILSGRKNKLKLKSGEMREKRFLISLLALGGENYSRGLLSAALGEGGADEVRFFKFTFAPLTPDDIAEACGSDKKTKVLYCNELTPEARELAAEHSLSVHCGDEVYRLVKSKGLMPEGAGAKKRSFKLVKRIKARFNRRLCPSLFFCGLGLIFFSFFTFFPTYYIVMGSILLSLAVLCLFFG